MDNNVQQQIRDIEESTPRLRQTNHFVVVLVKATTPTAVM